MILKLDINISKYIIIIVVLNCLISKIPIENLPLKNKMLLLIVVVFIFVIVDQSYCENFINLFSPYEVNTEYFVNNTANQLNNAETVVNQPDIANVATVVNQPVSNTSDTVTVNVPNVPKVTIQNQSLTNIINQSNANAINQTNNTPILTQPNNVTTVSPSQSISTTNNSLVNKNEDMGTSGLTTRNNIIAQTISENKAESCNCEDIANKAISKFLSNRRLLDNKGLLHYADAYMGDMGYSDIRHENYISSGSQGDGVYNSWDMGKYALINTSRWRPTIKNEGRCRTDTPFDPQPLDKGQMNLMNWDYERKVMGPDNINVNYINDKLNRVQ